MLSFAFTNSQMNINGQPTCLVILPMGDNGSRLCTHYNHAPCRRGGHLECRLKLITPSFTPFSFEVQKILTLKHAHQLKT